MGVTEVDERGDIGYAQTTQHIVFMLYRFDCLLLSLFVKATDIYITNKHRTEMPRIHCQ